MQCLLLALLFLLPSVVVSSMDTNRALHTKDEPPLPDIHGLSKEMFRQELQKLDPDTTVKPKTLEARRVLAYVKDDDDLKSFVFEALEKAKNRELTEKEAALEVDKWLYCLPNDKRNMMETRYPSLKEKSKLSVHSSCKLCFHIRSHD
ncbi:unnamed protein product [Haemonchus placei]|uniref:RxLR effector protein n=1 Tax=Haemonchus placei TaxID=6290 RepID=A0A0N4X7V1_HAEPC|nr:unnamed protein product [Haemonchus placei]